MIEKIPTAKYKLSYFPFRARAEFARYMLAYSGAEWKDDRFGPEEWPERQPKTPMGMVPVLSEEGKGEISQTLAVGMYLASKHGMAGNDLFEAARTLELSAGILIDAFGTTTPWIQAKVLQGDDEKASEEWKTIKSEKLAKYLDLYENFLATNGGVWFVGRELTWTDLVVAEFFERLESCVDECLLDDYPKLRDHYKRVHALDQLSKYLDSRPKTPF